MRYDSSLYNMLDSIVSVEPLTARTDEGVETFGAAVRYKAFVLAEQRKERAADGSDVVINGALITLAPIVVALDNSETVLSSLPTIQTTARLTLPDGRQPRMLTVEYATGDVYLQHLAIFAGFFSNPL